MNDTLTDEIDKPADVECRRQTATNQRDSDASVRVDIVWTRSSLTSLYYAMNDHLGQFKDQ